MSTPLRSHPLESGLGAIGLFMLSLAFLFIGNFIQFDDTSGSGSNEWLLPFGFLAFLAAIASLVVALPDASARRMLGFAMLVLDALVILQVITNDGFRFIWEDDEGELFQFEVVLGILGLALLTRNVLQPTEPTEPTELAASEPIESAALQMTAWARFVAYLSTTVVLVFIAFFMGVTHFENTECSGPDFGGECDLAGLEGMVWAAGVVLLAAIAIPTLEVIRYLRRSRR